MIEQVVLSQHKRIDELTMYKERSSALFSALKAELDGLNVDGLDAGGANGDSHYWMNQKVVEHRGRSSANGVPSSTQELALTVESQVSAVQDTLNAKMDVIEDSVETDTIRTKLEHELAVVERSFTTKISEIANTFDSRIKKLESVEASSPTAPGAEPKPVPPHWQAAIERKTQAAVDVAPPSKDLEIEVVRNHAIREPLCATDNRYSRP